VAPVGGLTEGLRSALSDVERGRTALLLARDRVDAALAALDATRNGTVDEGVAELHARLTAARAVVVAQLATLDEVAARARHYLDLAAADSPPRR
jgi:hypothetical protein